jgi:hypothetical protein
MLNRASHDAILAAQLSAMESRSHRRRLALQETLAALGLLAFFAAVVFLAGFAGPL